MHYKNLEVWKKSINLAISVYSLTGQFPDRERYRLSSQMQGAAVSIPSNIAEGNGRYSYRDNRRFVLQARGSLYELETQVLIAEGLGYMSSEERATFDERADEVGRLINGTVRSLNRQLQKEENRPFERSFRGRSEPMTDDR